MILIIIFVILLPINIFIAVKEFEEEDIVGTIFIFVFMEGLMFLLLNALALGFEGNYEVTAIYEQKQYKIYGLENKTSQEFVLDGQYRNIFCIGYGSIHGETNTEMNYYYFKENNYGRILENCPVNETYIREKDDIEPSLIWIVEERLYKGHPKLHKWFILVREKDEKQGIKIGTILEVPLNTIKIEYNVDV